MKAIILTTKQNHIWTSMQEIIPHIESLWQSACEDIKWDVETINVDSKNLKDYSKLLLEADVFIVTAFNADISRFLKITREYLNNAPWFFYLHNQATIGLWPLFEFGIGNLLTNMDCLIGTCNGDEKCLKLCFENYNFQKVLFSPEEYSHSPLVKRKTSNHFVFIGRISRQKNLHTLFVAFKELLLIYPDALLSLYGKADHLGSPNMGISSTDYDKELINLVETLNISESVHFYGFQQREDILKKFENESVIFIGPSLHSDENFGMAALMMLKNGHRAVLSDWGGHQNYSDNFANSINLINVELNSNGVFIRIEELSKKMIKAIKQEYEPQKGQDAFYFNLSKKNAVDLLMNLNLSGKAVLLTKTCFLKNILKKRKNFLNNGLNQKVFLDYNDEDAHKFAQAYGACDSLLKCKNNIKENILLPWVNWVSNDSFRVFDPIKGVSILDRDKLYPLGLSYVPMKEN